jgi:hypothetical protein
VLPSSSLFQEITFQLRASVYNKQRRHLCACIGAPKVRREPCEALLIKLEVSMILLQTKVLSFLSLLYWASGKLMMG